MLYKQCLEAWLKNSINDANYTFERTINSLVSFRFISNKQGEAYCSLYLNQKNVIEGYTKRLLESHTQK